MKIMLKAVDYFSSKYNIVDVPYIVDVDVSNTTKPIWADNLHHSKDKVYIASGEQSFIQLMKEGKLPYGRSMCLTPCYRDESILDDLHLKMFMKLELIYFPDPNLWQNTNLAKISTELKVIEILQDALEFYERYSDNIEVVEVDENQLDIYINGIEVGSYGLRETEYGNFVYGTGLALPRFNQAIGDNF